MQRGIEQILNQRQLNAFLGEVAEEAVRRASRRRWPAEHVPDPEGNPSPFHPGQRAVWAAKRRVVAALAGTQSGKTQFGPFWLAREIYGDTVNNVRISEKPFAGRGAGDYLAVTATYDLFKLKMTPALRTTFEDILGVGRYWAGDRIMELASPDGGFRAKRATDPMWGRIILRSADSPGGLEAATAKAAWLDEAGQDRFDLAAWDAIRRRLAIAQGRALITTTLYNLGWLKQEIHDVAVSDGIVTESKHDTGIVDTKAEMVITDHAGVGLSDIALIQFDSIINPYYPVEEFLDAMDRMPEDDFLMFWRGLVTKLRTLIYDCFDETVHKIPAFEIPHYWPRVVGIDPIGERIAAVWLAIDPEERALFAYREYYEPFGVTTPEHVRQIRKLSSGERIVAWIGGGPSERQARADWAGAGIPLAEPPLSDVWVGIGRVYQLLKSCKLSILDTCPNLLSEFGTYQRIKDSAGDLTDKIKDKEKFHMLDALRYIVAWVTGPQEVSRVVYNPVRIGRW